jgi:hypothetical protein
MPDHRFPEAFLEIGKDDDRSYNSFRTTRLSDGKLKIDVETWGIPEYGLYLNAEAGEILKLQVRGECATVPRKTWTKVSFSHLLEKGEETNIGQIEYRSHAQVDEGHIYIIFTLGKRAC